MSPSSTPKGRGFGRDPALDDAIAYFNEPKRFRDISALTSEEMKWIEREIVRVRQNFRYAAKNYHWIVNKESEVQLFSLNDAQEMLLEDADKLKAMGLPQLFLVLKARQLGISTFVQNYLAWLVFNFENKNVLTASVDEVHTKILYGFLEHVFDRLPWWLTPMVGRRNENEGLLLANPDEATRLFEPGLNSKVMLAWSRQLKGIGQGITLNGFHVSELGDWHEEHARQAVEGDLTHAVPDSPKCFGVIEGTGYGAGSYYSKLWRKMVGLGPRAKFQPWFLPWFFENKRRIAPDSTFVYTPELVAMRTRVASEWVTCSSCSIKRRSTERGESILGMVCGACKKGNFSSYVLGDDQLNWMNVQMMNAGTDGNNLKLMKQELATTPEDAFQVLARSVFPGDCLEAATNSVRPPVFEGFIDFSGRIHGPKIFRRDSTGRIIGSFCINEWCDVDHRSEDLPLKVWKWPRPGGEYGVGGDPGAGLGEDYDYSVAAVNERGSGADSDEIVAVYRSNEITPRDFAQVCVSLATFYNMATLAVEVNKTETAALVRTMFNYENIYRMRRGDNPDEFLGEYWGWYTTYQTKPELWRNLIRQLKDAAIKINSSNCVEEMKTYKKESRDRATISSDDYDDELTAVMIASYIMHVRDWDPSNPPVLGRNSFTGKTVAHGGVYEFTCTRCAKVFFGDSMTGVKCDACGSLALRVRRTGQTLAGQAPVNWAAFESPVVAREDPETYDLGARSTVMFDPQEWKV